ncbi:MAG: hypothetical protein U0Q16_01305 [Bryobacteraceae bacterium]
MADKGIENMKGFDWTRVVPQPLIEGLTDMRVQDAERISRAARQRRRRPFVTLSGRLNLVSVKLDAVSKIARGELLGRVISAISTDWCDGIVAPVPILEDLILLHDAVLERGAPGCLEHKLLIADGLCNAGRWLGGSPAACEEYKLDGLRARFAPETELDAAFGAIHDLAKIGVRSIIEAPLPPGSGDEPELAPAMAALASSLDMARFVWLALPYGADFSAALASTSLPVLLRPDPRMDAAQSLKRIEAALACGANARGVLCGPGLWRSPDLDPRKVVAIAGKMVHDRLTLQGAVEAIQHDSQPVPA